MKAQLSRGFTMVELIVVMIVVGILAMIGFGRFADRGTFDAAEFADQTRAMLRYAQKLAIGQSRPVFVRLDGNSVALFYAYQSGSPVQVLAPSGGNSGGSATLANCGGLSTWYCEGRPPTVTYSLSPAAPYAGAGNYFYFDAQGRPYSAGDIDPVLKSTFAQLSINIVGDGASRTVTVVPETGYVY